MWVSARHVVLFADREDLVDRSCHGRMVILPREAEVLREITLPDDHDPDPGDLLQHLWQIFDCPRLFAHDSDQYLALRVEWPDIGTGVIFLLRQPPIPRR